MKKTLLLLLLSVSLAMAVIATIYYDQTTDYVYKALGKEQSLSKTLYKDMTPSDITKEFWQLSKKGEFQQVENLITRTPPSYRIKCDGENKDSIDNKANNLPRVEVKDERLIGKEDDSKTLEEKQLSLLKQHSETINLSQFKDLTVKNEYIYEDEAIVEAEYEITKDYRIHEIFFLKRENELWKIFIASSLELSIYNANYAKERPPCINKN
ncbi:MAG: hypothetical protein ABWZ66_01560 [Pyrinomonadaceae bacterium]